MVANGNETKSSELDVIAAARQEAATLPLRGADAGPAADSFPGYELIGEIHRGAQGVVYRAIQESTQQQVALKVMHEGPFAGPHDRARFEREVQILGQLKHPNIVAIHDSGQAAGHFYFVMDFIPGESLDLHMAGDRMSVDDTLQLFGKICDAVNAAHLKGVIHRDLKPGNIRIDPDGEPHVLDFGLAKLAPDGLGARLRVQPGGSSKQAMTLTGQFIGSLPWASPEQASGRPDQIDTRTDVYALGVILYQMLTGSFPYEVVGNMRDVLDNILQAEPSRPSTLRRQINNEVETIILKCLQKERERRYQSAGELSRDVGYYLNGDPIEAKRDSGWYVLRKNLRRHKSKVLVAAACALLLTVFGIDAYQQEVREDALALVDEAMKLRLKMRRQEAFAKCEQALQMAPDLYEAIGYKAFLLKWDYFGRPYDYQDPVLLEQSLEWCERALQIKPDKHGLWNLKSVLLYSLGELDDAERAARRAIELDPAYYYAHSSPGKILALQYRFEEAEEALQDAVALISEKETKIEKLGKFDDGPVRTLGTLQLYLGQAEAVGMLKRASKINSRDNRNWLLLARLRLTLPGHTDSAEALVLAKLAKIATQLHDPRFNRILAQAYLANDKFADAIRHTGAAVEHGDRPAYCHLIAAIANAHLGESDLANDHLEQALGTWPAEFDEDDVIVTAEKGLLWFDTLAELQALRAEAEQAMQGR